MADLDDENDLEQVKETGSKIKETGKSAVDRTKKIAEQIKKNKGKASGKTFQTISKIASKLGPAIPYILLVLVIIIIVVGILAFIFTMPGLISGKLKNIAQGFADWWQKIYQNQAQALTNDDDIIEAANYIKSMGYDLIGYGFVDADEMDPDDIVEDDDVDTDGVVIGDDGYLYKDGERFEESGTYFDKYGIKYSTGGNEDGAIGTFEVSGEVKGFANIDETASLIRTYVMSDKRMFLIRNYDNGDDWDWTGWFDEEKGDWANGLISIYKAIDFKADEKYSSWERGSIKADGQTKTMTVKRGWTNNPMTFQMDGWTGRYGLSLEFLLSLHLATMAPELVSTMARTFDTEVQVYLDSVKNAQVDGLYYSEIKKDYFSIEDGDFYGWMTKKRTYQIMKDCGIKSQREGKFTCLWELTPEVVYANKESGFASFEDLTSSRTGDYYQDVILAPNSGDGANYECLKSDYDWSDILTVKDKTGTGYQIVKFDEKDLENPMMLVQNRINNAIWLATKKDPGNPDSLMNRFTIWEEGGEDENGLLAKNTDYNYVWYFDKDEKYRDPDPNVDKFFENTEVKSIDEIVSVSEFLDVSGSYDNGGASEFEIATFREPTEYEKKRRELVEAGVTGEELEAQLEGIEDNLEDCEELVISLLIYRTSGDGNYDFLTIAYISPSATAARAAADDVCSTRIENGEENDDFICCTNCRRYVRTLKKALKEVHDNDFNTYIPYIARVVDSWFRDTYFVVPESADVAITDVYNNHSDYGVGKKELTAGKIEFINVDDEYLKETEEHWSEFKMNADGTYKLYVLKANGEYETDINNIPASAKSKCAASDGAILYQGTEEEAVQDGVKLSKMVETTEIKSSWEAYQSDTIDVSEMVELQVDETSSRNVKLATNFDPVSKTYDKVIFYEMSNMHEVTQTEDGRRGITNSKIKKMFKVRKYYIYDGTSERAEAINNDWEKVLKEYSCSEETMNKWLDELYYGDKETTTKLPNGDPRDPSLIGNIAINKDSLSAFSILENTHTLDADYAYRDFKELIVELNYFDKEDLSDKKPEVFTWILPEITTDWPVRYIDKSEKYYGTYVHSEEAIKTIKGKLGIEVEEEAGGETEEEDKDDKEKEELENLKNAKGYAYHGETSVETETEEETDETTESTETTTTTATPGEVVSPVTGEIIKYGTYERVNTDLVEYEGLTEEDATETVGYIQIKIMDKKDYFKDLGLGDLGKTEVGRKDEKDTDKYSKIEALDLYYEEYENICDGYTITIDGIKLLDGATDLESLLSLSDSSFKVTESFEPNETPNIVDDDKEKENQQKENAKAEAPAVVKKGERIFVREGTIIGYTTKNENPNTTEDYSYIRIILRNEDKAIRENAEHYFDLPELSLLQNKEGVFAELAGVSSVSTPEERRNAVRAAVSYFKSMGFTTEAACGIVGNIIQESNLDPTADNGIGYHGLVQWNTNYGWYQDICSWLTENGYNEFSFEGQIRAIYECSNTGNMTKERWDELKSLTNIDQATELFCIYYEGCVGGEDTPEYYNTGYKYQGLTRRKINSKNAYDIYMGDNTRDVKDGQ